MIELTEKNLYEAQRILDVVNQESDWNYDDVIVTLRDGTINCYNRICGISGCETVLIERLEPDSLGEGWKYASPLDVINYLNSFYI